MMLLIPPKTSVTASVKMIMLLYSGLFNMKEEIRRADMTATGTNPNQFLTKSSTVKLIAVYTHINTAEAP